MGANERSHFFRRLEEFQDERGEDSGPPLFAKKAVDTFKLWNAVQEAGGFHMVTNNKGWARIGRLFDPPRTMTDLSFRIKKIYEVHLLPFEKAVEDNRFPDVYIPQRAATAQQPSVSRAGRVSTKRHSNSRATPTPSQRPKRARREPRHHGVDESLVGKVVKIYIPGEHRFSRATVESYERDMRMHKIRFEEGGAELLDLAEQEWMLDGPDNGLDLERLQELRNEAYALDDEEAFGNESDYEDLGPPKPQGSLPKDCVEDRIHEDRGYKVYYTSDGRGYEIFCLVPALQLESIRVKAWETGKILVRHSGQSQTSAKGDLSQLTYRIRLPTGIVATETQAIITLHQQLYVRVPMFIASDARIGLAKAGAIPQGESAVQAVTSETLEQEVKTPPDDEAAISPDRSNAISPEKVPGANGQPAEAHPRSNAPPQAGNQQAVGASSNAPNGRPPVSAQGPMHPQVPRATPVSHLNPNVNQHLNHPGSQLNPNYQPQPVGQQHINPQAQLQQMNPAMHLNPAQTLQPRPIPQHHSAPPQQMTQQQMPAQQLHQQPIAHHQMPPQMSAAQLMASAHMASAPQPHAYPVSHLNAASRPLAGQPQGMQGYHINGSAPQQPLAASRAQNGAPNDQRPQMPSADTRQQYMQYTHT